MDNARHRRRPVVRLTCCVVLPFLVRDTQHVRSSFFKSRLFTLCFSEVIIHLC